MILKRTTTLKCDGGDCGTVADIEHNLVYEGDSKYAFNKGVDGAGWGDVWLDKVSGYGHLCPPCNKKHAGALAVSRQRREAKLAKRRGHS